MDGYVTIGTKLDTSGVESGLEYLSTTLKTKTNKMVSTLKNTFSKIKKIIGIYGIYRLVSGLFDMGDAVDRVDTLNNYAKVMGNLGISAEEAQKSINILSDKLVGLPTTLDDAALAVQRFTSANNDIEVSTEMFLALNNAILAGGASTQIQKSALEQMSQAYAKGKPDMMEWRTAMMAMPAQLTQVAKAMGYVNSQQLGEAIRSSKVSMNEFMATIMKLNQEGLPGFQSFADQAKNSTGGIRTAIINLKTSITRALADIMNAIGQSNISNFINSIGRAIQRVVPYIAGFIKALMTLFGITGKTNKTTSKASVSMDNLGTSSAGTSKKLKGASKSAKDLNKELKKLASFDEMNILDKLEKSSSGGSGGASAGVTDMDMAPFADLGLDTFSSDLSDIATKTEEIATKMMSFLGPLVANWELLIGVIYGAKTAFFLFGNIIGEIGIVNFGGEILVLAGLIEIIIGLIEGDLTTVIQGLMILLEGLAVMMLTVNAANPLAWILLAVGAIGTLVTAIGKHNEKLSDEERLQRKVNDATKYAKEAMDKLRRATSDYTSAVDNEKSAKEKLTKADDILAKSEDSVYKSGKDVYDAFISNKIALEDMTPAQRDAMDAYIEYADAQENLKRKTKELKTANEEEAAAALRKRIAIAQQTGDYAGLAQAITDAYQNQRIDIKETDKIVAEAMKHMSDDARKTFLEELPQDILAALDKDLYAKAMGGLYTWWEKNIKKLNGKITVSLETKVSNKSGFAKGGIAFWNTTKIPRLASGGIINQPGRGVPMASAIGGERGMEGVIPLTDSQQMALLGEAIGKYITINANIVNEMNGRVISREIQKIQNESDFAFNG